MENKTWMSKEEIDLYNRTDRSLNMLKVYTKEFKATDLGELYYLTEKLGFVDEINIYNAFCKEHNLPPHEHTSIKKFLEQGRIIWVLK